MRLRDEAGAKLNELDNACCNGESGKGVHHQIESRLPGLMISKDESR
jgi:hypothetical protein